MNRIKVIFAVVLAAFAVNASAQFSQQGKSNEFMLKMEPGYAPFMGNVGTAGEHGFNITKYHNAVQFNALAGVNVSQDWFVGGGAGFSYFHNTIQGDITPMMGVSVFADVDFRPIWQGMMGLDYQPATIKWAPMVGARAGVSLILDHPYYGSPMTPMMELYGGINWYYMHGLRNMQHNWHSFYATVGVAYMQQTVFLPIRVGWRW
ncbi:MAG: hypothetical protein IJ524_06460 [Bacteroidales bacterium]|nr:hypothetical protein [Bacteroidales bacterium]